MIKKITVVFLLFFISCLFADNTRNILLIHSYHRGYKWSDDISKIFEKNYGNTSNTSLTTVYMDTKKIATPTYFDRLFDLFDEQFKGRKFDLVVAADNNALEFVIRYHEHLFRDLPVVFLGINNFDESMIYENNMRQYTTGVAENVDIAKNVDLILKLHKNCKKILIINDKSKTGYAVRRDIYRVLPRYKNRVIFEYIDDFTLDNLKQKVKHLSKDTVILWVLLFRDKTGKKFTYKESLEQIHSVSKVPIYGLWDFYLGYGIVGGLLTSATSQAKVASKMVDEILKGKNPREIPIVEKSPNEYIFDYKEIKRYNIKINKFVKKYKLVNKPFSFYEKYKKLVWITVSVFVVILVVLIVLILNIMKRKRSEKELANQLRFNRLLLDTVPNPIYYKDLNGVFLGVNQAFADMLNSKKDDIIGKKSFEFFSRDFADEQKRKDLELIEKGGIYIYDATLHLPHHKKAKVYTLTKAAYEDYDGNPSGIVCIMDDITERLQQKQLVIQKSKQIEMGEMIGAIAHQWNEPLVELSAITQDMEFTFKNGELTKEDMSSFVKEIMTQIMYMSKTVKDFRNFLKPSLKKEKFLVKEAIDGVLNIIERQVFYSNIDLSVNYADDKNSIYIYGYKNEFMQVLLNIINNAKAKIISSKVGDKISLYIKTDDDKSIITVVDNGKPIKNNIINRIFDPYFTTKKDGTGLGLYMAKMIIEDKMYGKIVAKNESGLVVFEIILPNKKV